MVNIWLIYVYHMVIIWLLYGYHMVIIWLMMVNNNLAGAITILKNMSSSMGRMTFHIENGKQKMFETTSQMKMACLLDFDVVSIGLKNGIVTSD